MLSFRQKILIGYLSVLVTIIALMFSFATQTVRTMSRKALKYRAKEVIAKINTAKDLPSLIQRLRDEKPQLFFRVSLLDTQGHLLYDSHVEDILGNQLSNYTASQPEIQQALNEETGYNEEYSILLKQKLIYVARTFDFHGQTLILRTAFPFRQVQEMIDEFEKGFLSLGSIVLILFSLLSWAIINHLSRPIQQIIRAIKPYQAGTLDVIPKINLGKSANPKDDFVKLAQTLNSLSDKIQNHIDTITLERNSKATLLESLGEGVIAVDGEMMVSYVNHVAAELLGMKKEEILGKQFYLIQQPQCTKLLEDCQKLKSILTSNLQLSKEKRIYLEVIAAPIGEGNGAVLVLQDKSGHYKMIEMGKDFIANASHELKTPITIIRGFAETLHDHPELPREISVDITEKIVRNCRRMEKIVRNLLTLADMENLPQSRLQECELTDLAATCRQLTLSVYPQAEITILSKHPECFVTADPDLLELAIMNLLDNAAKYSPSPAKITVLIEQHLNRAHIIISDQGIGIAEEDLEHIFDRFYTVNKAHSRKLGGAGLGLSIVKTIIEKHGGKIFATSTVGQGTSFHIDLPA